MERDGTRVEQREEMQVGKRREQEERIRKERKKRESVAFASRLSFRKEPRLPSASKTTGQRLCGWRLTNKKRGPAVSLPILRGGFVPGRSRGILKNSFGDLITSRTRRLISQVRAAHPPALSPYYSWAACNRYHATTCITRRTSGYLCLFPSAGLPLVRCALFPVFFFSCTKKVRKILNRQSYETGCWWNCDLTWCDRVLRVELVIVRFQASFLHILTAIVKDGNVWKKYCDLILVR